MGERIKVRRLNNEMTQLQLGKLIGVGKAMVSAIETGRFRPSLDVLAKIAKVFRCSVDELLYDASIVLAVREQPEVAQIYNSLSPEAIHLAQTWMQLSPARRAQIHEEVVWTAFFERKFPFYRIGRPTAESYDKLEHAIEANWEKMMRQAKLFEPES
jgi:putative transcriptional regulator